MPKRYYVLGESADTAATADHFGCLLWNASSVITIYVRGIEVYAQNTTVGTNYGLVRASTQGTAGATITPVADNDYDDDVAPPSGTLLYLGVFSVQPTIEKPYMYQGQVATLGASGWGLEMNWMFPGEPIHVPAGSGLGIATPVATIMQDTFFSFIWEEGT